MLAAFVQFFTDLYEIKIDCKFNCHSSVTVTVKLISKVLEIAFVINFVASHIFYPFRGWFPRL